MPMTFGAATTNNTSVTLTSWGTTGHAAFIAGWWRPTTLTAGRYWFSMSATSATANYGARVGTTTSTLQLSSNTNTTPGSWTATADTNLFPSGIVAGNWYFLAAFVSAVTGPTIAWRAWLGNESNPPTAMTIVQNTAPVGTPTGSTSNVIGNSTTTGTVSFEGDIGMINMIQGTSSVNSPLPIATAGTVTSDEALLIEQQYVQPLWLGVLPNRFPYNDSTALSWTTWENRQSTTHIRYEKAAGAVIRTDGASSGVTAAATEQPRVSDISVNLRLPPVRR